MESGTPGFGIGFRTLRDAEAIGTQLGTDLTFQSDAGGIRGTFTLNTTVPGN